MHNQNILKISEFLGGDIFGLFKSNKLINNIIKTYLITKSRKIIDNFVLKYNKYLLLYKKYIWNVKIEHCAKMIIDIEKELGKDFFFKAEPVVDVLYPFIKVWIISDYEVYVMKYYDFFTIRNIKMVHLPNYAHFYA